MFGKQQTAYGNGDPYHLNIDQTYTLNMNDRKNIQLNLKNNKGD